MPRWARRSLRKFLTSAISKGRIDGPVGQETTHSLSRGRKVNRPLVSGTGRNQVMGPSSQNLRDSESCQVGLLRCRPRSALGTIVVHLSRTRLVRAVSVWKTLSVCRFGFSSFSCRLARLTSATDTF